MLPLPLFFGFPCLRYAKPAVSVSFTIGVMSLLIGTFRPVVILGLRVDVIVVKFLLDGVNALG